MYFASTFDYIIRKIVVLKRIKTCRAVGRSWGRIRDCWTAPVWTSLTAAMTEHWPRIHQSGWRCGMVEPWTRLWHCFDPLRYWRRRHTVDLDRWCRHFERDVRYPKRMEWSPSQNCRMWNQPNWIILILISRKKIGSFTKAPIAVPGVVWLPPEGPVMENDPIGQVV